MAIYFFKDSRGNVGDDLNALLFPHYFEQSRCTEAAFTLVGVGTLINDHLPQANEYVFFTTGYGYQKAPDFSNARISAIGLRGPMTLEKIRPYLDEKSENIPLIDGAYLTPEIIEPTSQQLQGKVGLVPHVDSMSIGRWEAVAEIVGFTLIDPRWSPDKFIRELTSCSKVVTEAMHGAILADAYRIPWRGYVAHSHINTDKWHDWASSLSIPIAFSHVSPVFKGDEGLSSMSKFKNTVKRTAHTLNIASDDWTAPPHSRSSAKDIKQAAYELNNIVNKAVFYVSNESTVNAKLEHLKERILAFNEKLA